MAVIVISLSVECKMKVATVIFIVVVMSAVAGSSSSSIWKEYVSEPLKRLGNRIMNKVRGQSKPAPGHAGSICPRSATSAAVCHLVRCEWMHDRNAVTNYNLFYSAFAKSVSENIAQQNVHLAQIINFEKILEQLGHTSGVVKTALAVNWAEKLKELRRLEDGRQRDHEMEHAADKVLSTTILEHFQMMGLKAANVASTKEAVPFLIHSSQKLQLVVDGKYSCYRPEDVAKAVGEFRGQGVQ